MRLFFFNRKALRQCRRAYFYWSQLGDLNSRPTDYESVALPTELSWRFRHSFMDFCYPCQHKALHFSRMGLGLLARFMINAACNKKILAKIMMLY